MNRIILAAIIICAVTVTPQGAVAQESVATISSVAKVFSLQGSATIVRNGALLPVSEGFAIISGDEVRVGDPGRIAMELTDGSYVRLPSGSMMRFPEKGDSLNLLEGALQFFSHSEHHPEVITEHVTAAIRGTEFSVTTDKNQTAISMVSGSLDGVSPTGRAALAAGQGARFARNKPPELFTIISSEHSAQWSLFVPFLLSTEPGALPELGQKVVKSKDPCAPDNVQRGRMLVSGGDPEGGAALLESCVASYSSTPAHALATASLALVRLAQGDKTAAEGLSSRAILATPDSATARLARSFVLQERGDLEGALALIKGGATLNDDNLRAREAELQFMFGNVSAAKQLLEGIPDRSWYAEAIYGFVLLGDRSFDQAERAFKRAIQAEPGAALPHAGLGIVSFNKGELAEARKDFERATVLEPSRAMYRSYLAKDYFEDNNYAAANPEYERAIQLDPNDPTPYLYRSFMRVAENNLIGALDDLGKVRELSDKRDVYRSSFLLDQDSAVQAASIGRVYQQLGFKERGRVEAVTALTDNYQNASAHRLLSETQEDFFAADTILSERRMANLFAPLSINVVDSIGTGVSLNEYSQLLERDGWRTAVNSFYDSQNDTMKSGVLSAYKNENMVLGLSADGVGRNGITEDPRASAGNIGFSLQSQPSWSERFLLEGRGIITNESDSFESRNALNGHLSAAWLHHFSPTTTAILNSTYDRERAQRHLPINPSNPEAQDNYLVTTIFDNISETTNELLQSDKRDNRYETNVVNEAQLISDHGDVSSILTYRNTATDIDAYDQTSTQLEFADGSTLDIPLESAGPVNLNGNSVSYLGDLTIQDGLHLNFGGEFESIEFAQDPRLPPYIPNSLSQSLWSPKAGIVYKPDQTLIFRTGYGESLGKGTNTDLTSIEPTLIGGITQRYNDLPGTTAQTFGVGLDLHPRKSTFYGAEWTKRWLDLLQQDTEYDITIDFDTSVITRGVSAGDPYSTTSGQDFVSAYIYEVLSEHLVAGLDYRFAMQDIAGDDRYTTNDHRGKAFSRYFFTHGVFLQGSSTYRYQRENSYDQGGSNSDNAMLFGAGIGYRLPTRGGILLLDVQNIFGENIDINQASYFNEPVFSEPTVALTANFNF